MYFLLLLLLVLILIILLPLQEIEERSFFWEYAKLNDIKCYFVNA